MKKLIAILCVVMLVLSGCARPEPQPQKPATVYNETPNDSGFTVTVSGHTIGALYEHNGVYYLEEPEFLAMIGGTSQAKLGTDVHTNTVTVGDLTHTYTTADQVEPALFDGARWYLPCEGLLEKMGYHLLVDEEQKHHYYTKFPVAETLYKGVEVPVLMYHAIGDDTWGVESLFVSPTDLDQQMRYLYDHGYTPIWFEDLDRIEEIKKPIILTFDDGYEDNYFNLMPVLLKYKYKATVFSITGSIGTEKYMNESQMKKMQETGLISFQSHTVTHPDLSKCSDEELTQELLQSKIELARITGKEPFVVCYPMGKYSTKSLAKAKEYYEYGLFMSGSTFVTGKTDPIRIYRKYVPRSMSLNEFADLID